MAKTNKRMIVILFTVAALIFSCAGCGGSTVYKYYSITGNYYGEAQNSSADALETIAGSLFDSLLETMLKDSYIEINNDGTYSLYSPKTGFSSSSLSEALEQSGEELDITKDGDMLLIDFDGVIVSFKKATKEEITIYNKLKASAGNAPGSEASAAEEGSAEEASTTETPLEEISIPLGDYYATSATQGGETSDMLDTYICLVDETSGFWYAGGDTEEFHWKSEGSTFTFTDVLGSKFEGEYENGVITGTMEDMEIVLDSTYDPPAVPAQHWRASVYIDAAGDSTDMPFGNFDLTMRTQADNTGYITMVTEDGTTGTFPMKWSQRGNAFDATDGDGDSMIGFYYNGYLYVDYLEGSFVMVPD